jgi:hypothetical protein
MPGGPTRAQTGRQYDVASGGRKGCWWEEAACGVGVGVGEGVGVGVGGVLRPAL